MKGFSVGRFPFADHNVCDLKKVFDFCMDANLFLQQTEQLHRDSLEEKKEEKKEEEKNKTPTILKN